MSFRATDDSPKLPDPLAWPRYWLTTTITAIVVGAGTKLGEWAIEEIKAKRKAPGAKP